MPYNEIEYTAKHLEAFLNDTGGEWDWDDFTSVPLKNREMEDIREKALAIGLPVTDEDRIVLLGLLKQVKELQESRSR